MGRVAGWCASSAALGTPAEAAELSSGAALREAALSCGVCRATPPTMPFAARPCGHAFCYYCVAAHTLVDEGSSICPLCSQQVAALQRLTLGGREGALTT